MTTNKVQRPNALPIIMIIALNMSNTLAMSRVVAKTIPFANRKIPKNKTVSVSAAISKIMNTQNRMAVTRSTVPSIFTATIKLLEIKGF